MSTRVNMFSGLGLKKTSVFFSISKIKQTKKTNLNYPAEFSGAEEVKLSQGYKE